MTQAKLLSEYTRIMNVHGLDSREEKEFLEAHKDKKELMELCALSRLLKQALNPGK